MNAEQLEKKRKLLVLDFSEEDLEAYVNILAERYYSSYFNNEADVYYNTVEYLKEVISLFSSQYNNINSYINLALLKVINNMLNTSGTSEIKLMLIDEDEVNITSEENFSDLASALRKSRNLVYEDKIKDLQAEIERLKNSL